MPNILNEAITAEYESLFDEDLDALFVQPVGMSVEDVGAFRAKLRESSLQMRVVKNSLARRVLGNLGFEPEDDMFAGPSAMIIAAEGAEVDAVAISAAKIVAAWVKESKKELPVVKGGVMEKMVLDGAAAADLKRLPGKEELRSIIVGQIVGPGSKLSAQLIGPGGALASQIEKHKDNQEAAG